MSRELIFNTANDPEWWDPQEMLDRVTVYAEDLLTRYEDKPNAYKDIEACMKCLLSALRIMSRFTSNERIDQTKWNVFYHNTPHDLHDHINRLQEAYEVPNTLILEEIRDKLLMYVAWHEHIASMQQPSAESLSSYDLN